MFLFEELVYTLLLLPLSLIWELSLMKSSFELTVEVSWWLEELFAFEQELKHSDRELVSVHVRRGDYLDFWDKYGGICDELYYNNALKKV